jgi:serine/threonine protein kinase
MISPTIDSPTTLQPSNSTFITIAQHPKSETKRHTNLDFRVVNLSNYTIKRVVSNGEMSILLLATTKDEQTEQVLKLILKQQHHKWQREVDIHSKLSHENILPCKQVIDPVILSRNNSENTVDCVALVLDYCTGPDLFSMVSPGDVIGIHPAIIKQIMLQIVDAVMYLHSLNIAHRDIKLENIMLDSTDNAAILRNGQDAHDVSDLARTPRAMLIDFGLSKQFTELSSSAKCGSEEYLAPEIILGSDYNPLLPDIWALGVVLYALLFGNLPFLKSEAESRKAFFARVCLGLTETVPGHVGSILHGLMTVSPSKRIRLDQVKELLLQW